MRGIGRIAVMGAVMTAAGMVVAVPASSAAESGLNLVFDTWVPSAGDCKQRVTFRVQPSAAGDAPIPTGTVRLVSDTGDTVGSVPVRGFGRHAVTGTCPSDTARHQVTLAYEGDPTYPARSVSSPDRCPRDRETLPQETWNVMVGAGSPRPVFVCHTDAGFSIRSGDGRLHTQNAWSALMPKPWEYGERAEIWFEIDGDPHRQPTAPTGSVAGTIDGRRLGTFTVDSSRSSYTWRADTTRIQPGAHSWRLTYGGDPRWAPATIARQTFRLVRARPAGSYRVDRWRLSRGERPAVTLRFRNKWSRTAKAPTGRLDFYLGTRHVHATWLRRVHQGRRTVTLPPVRRAGTHLLRVVYRGDSRYKALDSAGPYWYSAQQYLRVR